MYIITSEDLYVCVAHLINELLVSIHKRDVIVRRELTTASALHLPTSVCAQRNNMSLKSTILYVYYFFHRRARSKRPPIRVVSLLVFHPLLGRTRSSCADYGGSVLLVIDFSSVVTIVVL